MVKRSILIALPIDHSSLILGNIWSIHKAWTWNLFISVHKLIEDVDNEVTIYIDQGIQNDFMSHVVDDLRSHSTTDIKMTSSQVRMSNNKNVCQDDFGPSEVHALSLGFAGRI